jgi:methionyl aminopeptidase
MNIELLRQGGDIHKQVQEYTKSIIKADSKLIDLATAIESKIQELTHYDEKNPLAGGVAFPTGLSVNNCAAHWSPNPSDTYQILKEGDLIKIDFGVQLDGYILDGAFSYSTTDRFDDLISVSMEATACGIKSSGPDAILGEIGSNIQEIIENAEVEIDGKVVPVKSTMDLCGHQIGRYHIHAGKAVPNIKINYKERMKIGEQYAIETFPTTGSGRATMRKNYKPSDCSHYMIANDQSKNIPKKLKSTYNKVYSQFGTLAFCNRWCDLNIDERKDFNTLTEKYIQSYPPLYDTIDTAYVAQTEKSIYISDNGTTVLN